MFEGNGSMRRPAAFAAPILAVIIFASTVCVSCGPSYTALDYFTFRPGACVKYTGTGDPNANQDVYVDFSHPDKNQWQRRIVSGNTTVGECYSYSDGELKLTYSDSQMTYVSDMTADTSQAPVVELKEPLTKGRSWSRGTAQAYTSTDPGAKPQQVDVTATVTGVGVSVRTPYGNFNNALEITETFAGTEQVIREYYAPGVGLVETLAHSQSVKAQQDALVSITYADITIQLSSITDKTPYEFDRNFFYPNPDSASADTPYEVRHIIHDTNENIDDAFNKAIAEYGDPAMKAYMDGVTLNHAWLFVSAGRLKADFTGRLTANAAGMSPDAENATLMALVNTLAYFYVEPRVCVTVNGQPYNTANIKQTVDQYTTFKVQLPAVK